MSDEGQNTWYSEWPLFALSGDERRMSGAELAKEALSFSSSPM